MASATATAEGEFLPPLDVDGPGPQSRLTVGFRLLLVIPHLIVLVFVGIAAYVVQVIGWFAALFTGRLPDWAFTFLSGYLAWWTRVSSYLYLMVDQYPPFAFLAPDYPVRIEVRSGPLNRLAVLFRFILLIPAAIVSAVLASGWQVAGFVIWLAVLINGGMPQPLFEATAAVQRFVMRYNAYTMLLTSAYPKHALGDEGTSEAAQARASGTRPLLLGSSGRTLVIVFIVLGVLSIVGQVVTRVIAYS